MLCVQNALVHFLLNLQKPTLPLSRRVLAVVQTAETQRRLLPGGEPVALGTQVWELGGRLRAIEPGVGSSLLVEDSVGHRQIVPVVVQPNQDALVVGFLAWPVKSGFHLEGRVASDFRFERWISDRLLRARAKQRVRLFGAVPESSVRIGTLFQQVSRARFF